MVLGWDAAGVVDAVGPDVTAWAVGDRAVALSRQAVTQIGTLAELVLLDEADLAPYPGGVDVLHAATLPLAALTAHRALAAALGRRPGHRCRHMSTPATCWPATPTCPAQCGPWSRTGLTPP